MLFFNDIRVFSMLNYTERYKKWHGKAVFLLKQWTLLNRDEEIDIIDIITEVRFKDVVYWENMAQARNHYFGQSSTAEGLKKEWRAWLQDGCNVYENLKEEFELIIHSEDRDTDSPIEVHNFGSDDLTPPLITRRPPGN
jgi:hypothetical protein